MFFNRFNATSRPSLLACAFVVSAGVGGCAATSGMQAGPGERLAGAWHVAEIGGKPVVANSQVTMVFDPATSRFSGDTSCNGYGGQYTLKGSEISISRPVMTLKACEPALMEQEGRFVEFLQQSQAVDIDAAGALVLRTGGNATLKAVRR